MEARVIAPTPERDRDTIDHSLWKAGTIAVLGALIGVALTPFMASVWAYEPGVVWAEQKTLIERSFGPLLESRGLLDFGREGLPYEVYGKGFSLVYLLMVPMVRVVRAAHPETGKVAWLVRRAWRAMYGALLIAVVGDATSYWGNSLPGFVGEQLWGWGFVVESLAIFALLLASLSYGIAGFWHPFLPRWAAALLVLAALPGRLLTNLYVADYWPNALVVPLSISWATIGIGLWLSPNPPKDTDGRREESGRVVRELQGK